MGRHGAGFVRYLLTCLRRNEITTRLIAEELGVSVRWVQRLYSRYLEACACGNDQKWVPGQSGGNRYQEIPPEVVD